MAKTLGRRAILWAALVLLAPGSGMAQTLSDPTQPAILPSAPNPQHPGAAVAAPVPQAGLRLVVTAKEGNYALVNGQRLKVGDKLGESVIVAIEPSALVLRDANGRRERMNLFPALNAR